MVTKEVIIKEKGLESKAAALLIQKASEFKSSIWIQKDNKKANAKSLLGLLSLSIAGGTKVLLGAEGEDENIAIDELSLYISK